MVLKISLMLMLSLALHSMNPAPSLLAKATPYSQLTLRQEGRQSDLLPTIILQTESWFSLILLIQLSRLSKLLRSVTEQTRMTPSAPLQQVWVMVLNLSWPAVSQMCILILTPSTSTVFTLKSTPMVEIQEGRQLSAVYLRMMLVLPTAVSPIITVFTKWLYSSPLWFFFSIIRLQCLSKLSEYQQQECQN